MREVLQLIKPSADANNRELMTEAAKLRDKYSTHAICDALQIDRGTFYNHIFRSKGKNSVYAIRDRQLSDEIKVAEGEGFEPPVGIHPQRFSRPPRSTTPPTLQQVVKIGQTEFDNA